MTILEVLERARGVGASRTALRFSDGSLLTFGELHEHVVGFGCAMRRLGIGAQDRVGVSLGGRRAALAFLSASAFSTTIPVDPYKPPEQVSALLRRVRCRALLSLGEANGGLSEIAKSAGIPVYELNPEQEAINHTPSPAMIDDAAVILQTSGSTAEPKLVPLSHRNLVTTAEIASVRMHLTTEDSCLNLVQLEHKLGIGTGLLMPIVAGSSVFCLHGLPVSFARDWMNSNGVSCIIGTPALLSALADLVEVNGAGTWRKSLRFVRCGSAALSGKLAARLEDVFGVPVVEAYGMTEAGIASNNLPPFPRKPGKVGTPLSELRILDQGGSQVPVGEIGEIAVRGPTVFTGYLDPTHDDDRRFVGGWFLTGDFGFLDEDNYLELTGRKSDLINKGGLKIAPSEIEASLTAHPDIREAVVFAVPHPSLGEDVAAAVVVEPHSQLSEVSIRRHLTQFLVAPKIPTRIVLRDDLPRGQTGKIERRKLPQLLAADLAEDDDRPTERTEAEIIELFRNVLRHRTSSELTIGRNSNFFQLGGDSLNAAQLVMALSAAGLGLHTVEAIFDAPTPAGLARWIREKKSSAGVVEAIGSPQLGANLVLLRAGAGTCSPLFFVHGWGGTIEHFRGLVPHMDPSRAIFGIWSPTPDQMAYSSASVEDLASKYARQMLDQFPSQPVHLAGFSAGGWYAYAVVDALLKQGGRVATITLMDTDVGTTRVGAHLAMRALYDRLQPRFCHHVLALLAGDIDGGIWQYSRLRFRALRNYLNKEVRRIVLPYFSRGSATSVDVTRTVAPLAGRHSDPFMDLLARYRPPKLQVKVVVLGPEDSLPRIQRLWQGYAIGGVTGLSLFDEHLDFIDIQKMPALSCVLDKLLQEGETAQPVTSMRS